MAGRGDITAGRAFVELFVKKGAFIAGLADAQARLTAFAGGLRTIGVGMMAVGGAITAPLLAALAHFESAGSALNDMAARTGASVEALGQLSYAADQTGTSIEDVEKAIVKLHRTMAAAKSGSVEARKAFADLRLDWRELAAMSPDEQFNEVAKAIAQIENPAQRAATAIELLGKSAASLLPMIDDLEALRKEAQELGAMTAEEAKLADDFGDALGRLRTIAANTANVIGSSLAPAAIEFLDGALQIAKEVLAFARANQELTQTVATVGLAIAGAGAFFIAFATPIATAIDASAAFVAVAGSLLGALGLLLNPVVLLVGALGGAAYALYSAGYGARQVGGAVSFAGRQVQLFANYARTLFGDVAQDFDTTWRGIVDAVSAGDLQLAADVAWAGLMVAWQTGVGEINRLWQDAKWYFLQVWGEASTAIAEFFNDAFATVMQGWNGFTAAIAQAWNSVTASIAQAWNSIWTNEVAQKSLGRALLIATDLARVHGLINEAQRDAIKFSVATSVKETIAGGDKNQQEIERNRSARENEIENRRAERTLEIDRNRRLNSEALKTARDREKIEIDASYSQATKDREEALKAAREELDLKRRAAAGQAEAAKMLRQREEQKPGDQGQQAGISGRTVGAFSAASLFAMGGGTTGPKNIAANQLKELEKVNKNIEETNKLERARQMEAYA